MERGGAGEARALRQRACQELLRQEAIRQGLLAQGVVLKDGPADQAGIKPGDILQAVDGDEISNSAEVLNLVAALPPGRTVLLTIIRSQSEKSFKVTVGKRPPS